MGTLKARHIWIFLLFVPFATGAARLSPIAASIFGNEGHADRRYKDQGAASSNSQPPPPPPPPPKEGLVYQQDSRDGYNAQVPPPLVPGYWEETFLPPPSGQDMEPMPYPYALEDSLERERSLLIQIDNLTAALSAMEQREDLHSRQMDVLTERVMEVEASAASEHNELLEYRSNCTRLEKEIGIMSKDVDEWKEKCNEFTRLLENEKSETEQLRKDLKKAKLEAEDLAAMIERQRLSASTTRSQKKPKRSFFSWLFGINPVSDEDYEDLQDRARSTLLKALNEERKSVEELESIVSILQQNNSAIAEQVRSRDFIIEELNERVAVFEEDKVVLKAALRQLQKEMNDEAPKIKRLENDLVAARQQIDDLHEEIEVLIETHQDEVQNLQNAINDRENGIAERESNLTVIGNYVDKLEERLTDFAVARRDIERRERKCAEMEKRLQEKDGESIELQEKLKASEAEHAELKKLLEELATARANIQNETVQLREERNLLKRQMDILNTETTRLNDANNQLMDEIELEKALSIKLATDLNTTKTSSMKMEDELHELRKQIELMVNGTLSRNDEFEELRLALHTEAERRKEAENREVKTRQELEELKSRPPPPAPKPILTDKVATVESQGPSTLKTGPKPDPPTKEQGTRKVLFRKTRKFLSHATGLHGLITPPSDPNTPKVSWKIPEVPMPKIEVPSITFAPKKGLQDAWEKIRRKSK